MMGHCRRCLLQFIKSGNWSNLPCTHDCPSILSRPLEFMWDHWHPFTHRLLERHYPSPERRSFHTFFAFYHGVHFIFVKIFVFLCLFVHITSLFFTFVIFIVNAKIIFFLGWLITDFEVFRVGFYWELTCSFLSIVNIQFENLYLRFLIIFC